VNFFQNLWNDEFVEGFLAIAIWARDQVPLPGGVFRQTVERLIRQNALYEGVIPHGRGELRLESGHIGFVAGRQAAKVARPQIRDWLASHSDEG
jgi:hypothetical protein